VADWVVRSGDPALRGQVLGVLDALAVHGGLPSRREYVTWALDAIVPGGYPHVIVNVNELRLGFSKVLIRGTVRDPGQRRCR
jgi:hypothetical protein